MKEKLLHMKPYDQLTPRQKFFRQNIVRVIIYGGFLLPLVWTITQMVAPQDEKQAQYNRIEDTMMEYYKKTKGQMDTVGMADYMREHLSPDDYRAWQKQGE